MSAKDTHKMADGEVTTTGRGFQVIRFTDRNGEPCSLQQSSAFDLSAEDGVPDAGASFVWLGCDNNAKPHLGHELSPRMHLTRKQVSVLVRHLVAWLETGEFGDQVLDAEVIE